jgi:hypothetical protein
VFFAYRDKRVVFVRFFVRRFIGKTLLILYNMAGNFQNGQILQEVLWDLETVQVTWVTNKLGKRKKQLLTW